MQVEMLAMHRSGSITGIGRYMSGLIGHMPDSLQIQLVQPKFLPLARQFSPLQSMPIGIIGHKPGRIVHFPQIMGCSLMLWHPVHPSVATVHDLGSLIMPEEEKLMDPVARQILRLSILGLKRIDRIMTQSEYTRQSVLHTLKIPPDRVITNHTAIDKGLFYPRPGVRRQLEEIYPVLSQAQGPWLLYVGSELPRKNLGVILQALGILRQSYPNLTLIKIGIAGRKEYRDTTLGMSNALGISNAIFFLEDVADNDLPLFYSSATMLVHPSRLEGFGLPILEAMACGTPVVCANATALPEVAGGAARLASPDNVKEWVNSIRGILDNPNTRQELSNRGLVRAAGFTWERTANATIAVYQKLSEVYSR